MADRPPGAEDRIISTVDSDGQHAHTTRRRGRDRFKAHRVAEPDTGLITGCTLGKASGPDTGDATVGLGLPAGDATIDGPVQVPGDSDYGTGAMLAALAAAGHTAPIKPWPVHSPIPGGFTPADVTV